MDRYFGAYEILEEVTRDPWGAAVYKARDDRLNRIVSLEVFPNLAPRDRVLRQLQAEASLQHPLIIPLNEVGEYEGIPYAVRAWVEGVYLDRKLDGTPQPNEQAARWVKNLAEAVHHVHQRGIIHGDVKPASVLLTPDGVPLLTGFDCARPVPRAGDAPPPDGAVFGSPSYMAPEQAQGRNNAVGPHTDVFGLGSLLYELLTGRPPFRGATALDTLLNVIEKDPVPPRERNPRVDADLETVCLTCLRKEPARRYPSAEALAEDLRRYLKGEPLAPKGETSQVGWLKRWWRGAGG
jgi:serine/threonine-protein kinase